MPGSRTAESPSLKDSLDLLTAIAGALALLTPLLAILVRVVGFSLSLGYGPSAVRLAVSLPVAELTTLGIISALPLLLVLLVALATAKGLPAWPQTRMGFVRTCVFGAIALLLLPWWPSSIGIIVVAVVGVYLIDRLDRGDGVRRALPAALTLVLLLALTFGVQYRAGPSADFHFDNSKTTGVADGTYQRIAEDDNFVYLVSCLPGAAHEVTAVPVAAILTITIPKRPRDDYPSLIQVLAGAPVVIGALLGCP